MDRPTLERIAGGGWQLSSIFQARGGLPEDITLISGIFGNPVRPNYVPGQNPYLSHISWLNPGGSYNSAAFSVPTGYDGTPGQHLGNVGRNWLRGPGFFQWDFSAMKSFDVTEKVKLQFRTDLFNIINHPNYSNPDGGLCSALNVRRGRADRNVHAQSVLRADHLHGREPDGQRADWQWNRPAGAVLLEVVVLMAKRAARPRRVARIRPRKEADAQHCG